MLFNSYEFILLFIPAVAGLYYLFGHFGWYRAALSWLVLASLFFYGWWNPVYLLLLLISIGFNFLLGRTLSGMDNQSRRRLVLIVGISANLGALAYFKYANFFVDNINWMLGTGYHLKTIILPLAISFFTFQQITFLVDAYRREIQEPDFLSYCLFVTFFPQLIAGPIVHHSEMLPQFFRAQTFVFNHAHLAVGSTIFIIGLFKKVVIADEIALHATPMFNAARDFHPITFFEAWGGALAYTFQLYFDFSGYSDMAVGLAYLFGIRLPLNFYSPYKASSIIEFWRRWHISLSRFLRDYLYIPLGGSYYGRTRRYTSLMVTMLLGGLWHGAGWTFVAWGALHGVYLCVNYAWRGLRQVLGRQEIRHGWISFWLGRIMTFLAVVIAWVFFRSESFSAATNILKGMLGLNGVALPTSYRGYLNNVASLGDYLQGVGWAFEPAVPHFGGPEQYLLLALLLLIVWFAPNTYQLLGGYSSALDITHVTIRSQPSSWIAWQPRALWAIVVFAMFWWSIQAMDRTSEFLYFQF
ncbi:MBOAT family protein [Candidatus Nitrospira neomarina]|uniref:MBOAT family protein n=2 Tax=Candidatus Nitrospira neomarina TaxID=3020899 RepID=A0AA96GLH2_9BACT|nr:MBOAT family protein [Candidatus Nitrospira neomarina]